MDFKPASQLTLPTLDWLWLGHLPLEHPVLLDGDPGLGKSLLTLDLTARLTTGRELPDGAPGVEPISVLLICAEDPTNIILSRLHSMNADLSRVFLWPRDAEGGLPRLPADLQRLDDALAQTGARFVVLDPLMALLDHVNVGSDISVRAVLGALAKVVATRRCTALLVRHLNKKIGQPALYRGGGSIAFVAACRLAWLASTHPRQPERFVLAQNKNNYAPLQPSLAYSLHASGVSWHGICPLPAAELASHRPNPRLRRAAAFWNDILKNGPRLSREVHAAARRQGISVGTLRRAQNELDIRCPRLHQGANPMPYYRFPHQKLPSLPGQEAVDAWLLSLDEEGDEEVKG